MKENSKGLKIAKIVIFVLLCLIDTYLLYGTIGYLILGGKAPKIVGVENTRFMGMYLMSITYFCIFAVVSGVIIFLGFKFFGKKKSKDVKAQKIDYPEK